MKKSKLVVPKPAAFVDRCVADELLREIPLRTSHSDGMVPSERRDLGDPTVVAT
jgi:hypothetical protein